jgi:hypothetical protein
MRSSLKGLALAWLIVSRGLEDCHTFHVGHFEPWNIQGLFFGEQESRPISSEGEEDVEEEESVDEPAQ